MFELLAPAERTSYLRAVGSGGFSTKASGRIIRSAFPAGRHQAIERDLSQLPVASGFVGRAAWNGSRGTTPGVLISGGWCGERWRWGVAARSRFPRLPDEHRGGESAT